MELENLERRLVELASLDITEAPVVSCYFDLEPEAGDWRGAFEKRVRLLRAAIHGPEREAFETALAPVQSFLDSGLYPEARGAAAFSRAGERAFFCQFQFRTPLPNRVSVGPAPCIYHLVEMKDTYHRYLVMISTEERVRVLGVNLGDVTEEVWRTRPELRSRAGRAWSKEHYRSHREKATHRFVQEQIRVAEQLAAAGGYRHLILAGNSRVTAQIQRALPQRLAAMLVDVVPASRRHETAHVIAATLASFAEAEERESLAAVERLKSEIRRHGLGVAGVAASFHALHERNADLLVIARYYDFPAGWMCRRCGAMQYEDPPPARCSECGAAMREFSVREELVRLTQMAPCGVEVVNHSEALDQMGGVGCLLRYARPQVRREAPTEACLG